MSKSGLIIMQEKNLDYRGQKRMVRIQNGFRFKNKKQHLAFSFKIFAGEPK